MSRYRLVLAIVVALVICIKSGDVVVDQEGGDGLRATTDCDASASTTTDHVSSSCSSTVRTSSSSSSSSSFTQPSQPKTNYTWIPEAEHPCNIERFTLRQLYQRFGSHGVPSLYPKPLVIDLQQQPQEVQDKDEGSIGNVEKHGTVAVVDHSNHHFRQLTSPTQLLDNFPPDYKVTLSSSNSYSEHRRTIPLSQYIQETLSAFETTPDVLSNETWYLFGETYTTEWQELLRHYQMPPCHTCTQRSSVALAFGLGNRGSGVQWHVHGPGFSQAIHGRKHWILAPTKPNFHPNTTSRYWMEYEYPKYPTTVHDDNGKQPKEQQRQRLQAAPDTPVQLYECTLLPGDLLYFPNNWFHATINLDPYTAFVSSFTTEHKMEL